MELFEKAGSANQRQAPKSSEATKQRTVNWSKSKLGAAVASRTRTKFFRIQRILSANFRDHVIKIARKDEAAGIIVVVVNSEGLQLFPRKR